ncbi:hypothetical protein PCANC_16768 [Puccinia coronata f. sp. avenae]|uniref:CCHC-type domain-containing protein n=1 Tax=Puccinia coronata f. sp. avenae TaxID=200324 RepID=A0A2N5URZ4_9BASI|nr:hypothetical protein PCANC_16768 [Puccinia coronata f. sp. avenae]
MLHVSEFSPPAPNTFNVNIPDSLTDKIDGLQDIILGMHSVNDDKIEKLSRSFHHMEDQLREQVLDLKQKLLDSQKREEDILEQVRRRLGDLSSLSASIKERVDKSALENQKPSEYSQPLRYNNPMMNEQSPSDSGARKAFHYRTVPPKIPSGENTGTHPPLNNNPQWLTEFPFINHDHVDVEMRKELWKSIPKTSEWEKFSGELPYNHELWLKNIDVFVQDYCMLDHMIISRLTALFTDTAKNWYIGIRDNHDNRSWAWWKNTIRNKFGTHNWKWKMQQEFEKDYFTLENKKVHNWFNTQRERLRDFQPELSEYLICEKVLKQCPGNLEHAVKSRYKKEATEMNFEEMVIIIEEVLDRAMKYPRPAFNNSSNQFSKNTWSNNPSSTKVEPSKTEPNQKKPSTTPAHMRKDSCNFCKQPGHFSRECPKRRQRINEVGIDNLEDSYDNDNENQNCQMSSLEEEEDPPNDSEGDQFVLAMNQDRDYDSSSLIETEFFAFAVECETLNEYSIAEIQAESHQPQTWHNNCQSTQIEDARLMRCKPDKGKAHLIGFQTLTTVLIQNKDHSCLLDSGASCSIISNTLLKSILPEWKDQLMPITHARFHSCSDQLKALGIIELALIFPHTRGSVRIVAEFVVMENARMHYLILGNDYQSLYGFDITNSKERYFTIGNENKKKKFSFKSHNLEKSPISSDIAALKESNPDLNKFIKEDLSEAKIYDQLTNDQKNSLFAILFKNKGAFADTDQPLGAIKGHEVSIKLTTERPFPPLLRRPPYPASPKSREALDEHIEDLVRLNVLRKVGHNEVVEITTPVIIAWHNGKSRMVGDFRALNTYTSADRYPIPKISETLNNLAKAKFLTSMDVLKGFHQNVIAPDSRQYLRIICHKGIYEYLRMPFGIKNAPSHFQRMMDMEFRKELAEKWIIIYIDDIIIMSNTWEEHLQRLDRTLKIVTNMNMRISLKKCNFGFHQIKALGHVVSGIAIGIDQNKVAAVLQKPVPSNRKEVQSFLGFAGYYRQHIDKFAEVAKPLTELCKLETVFEMTHQRLVAYNTLIRKLTTAPLLLFPDWKLPFKLYVDASMIGLGAALHQVQTMDGMLREGPVVFISRQLKDSEARLYSS